MNSLNVYSGASAINDFLNPKNHLTPLVELDKSLNPLWNEKVHIYIKMQTFLPLMNVKSVPAFEMLKRSQKQADNLVESSSGNMAFSLTILSKLFGYEKMRSVVSDTTSAGKLQMLLLAGSEIWVNHEPENVLENPEESGIEVAKRMGEKKDWQNFNQYANINNPLGHYENCAKQIVEQLNNDIQVFGTTLGTTGTMSGIAKYLKEYTQAQCIGVVKKEHSPVPGPRSQKLLNMIELEWRKYVDEVVEGDTQGAYLQSLNLCRKGLLVGPSSGLSLDGLIFYLQEHKNLEKLRNREGKINCVILGCDLPFMYMDEYFKYLPRHIFPEVYNQALLKEKIGFEEF